MIIWSGFGFLVAIIGFVALVVTEWIAETLTNNGQFYQQNPWLILIGMMMAALLTVGLHRLLLFFQKPRTVIDKATGAEIQWQQKNTLFFVPVKWWPLVFMLLGILFVFVGPDK